MATVLAVAATGGGAGAAEAAFTSAPGFPMAAGDSPAQVVVADFTGDGKLDMAVSDCGKGCWGTSIGGLSMLLGQGGGAFAPGPSTSTGGAEPFGITAGDFNGDARLDLAVANTTSDNLGILLGTGGGSFSPASGSPISLGDAPTTIATADFNRDHKLDLVVTDCGSICDGTSLGDVVILLGAGDGSFAKASGSPITSGIGANPNAVATGDFNGDGKPDFAVTVQGLDKLAVMLGAGDGTFAPASGSPYNVGASPTGAIVADINGDHVEDLVVSNCGAECSGAGSVSVLLGDGNGTFRAAAGSPFPASNPFKVAAGDLNGDGKQDLATISLTDVAEWLGAGDGTFTSGRHVPTPGVPYDVAIADANDDGQLDLVVANASTNNVSLFLNTGSGQVGSSPQALAFADQTVGSASARKVVTVSNTAPASPDSGFLRVASTTLTGPGARDFVIVSDGCSGKSLATGDSCEIAVAFKPAAAGDRHAELELATNTAGSPQTVALSGAGLAAPSCTLTANARTVVLPRVGSLAAAPGTLELTARCDQAVSATLSGIITVKLAKTKTIRIRSVTRSLGAGKPTVFTIKLPNAALTYLGQGTRESASFTLTVKGAKVAAASIPNLKAAT